MTAQKSIGGRRKGTLYKAVYVEYAKDPLPSRSNSGRFHDKATGMNTTYLTPAKQTAWREVTFRWKADPKSYRIAQVEVNLKSVADLTDPIVQKEYSISRELLTGDDYKQTQRLANALRAEGVEAAWTYSRADQPDGRMLVVFVNNLRTTSYVRLKAVKEIGS